MPGPPGNVIAGNAGNGIGVSFGAFGVTGLTIKGNSIFSNGGLGIDLGVNGVTLNDDGDVDSGVNDLQNFPVITQVTRGPNFTNFSGTLDAAPNTSYDLEFFANDAIDPNGYGEGQTFLVALTGIMTNASGHVGFSFQTPKTIGSDQRLTATATDPNGNTSEFSGAIGQLLNISTRMNVLTGQSSYWRLYYDGLESKSILVRALGPTLGQPPFNLSGVLGDPTLALFQGGTQLAPNDNWADTQQSEINATGKAPPNAAESAIFNLWPLAHILPS